MSTSAPRPELADSTPSPRRTDTPAADRVMIAVVAVTLAAGCLLISAGEGSEAGHRAWRSGSILRIVTDLMTLNRQYPTATGVEIKWLVQGLGAAAALLAGAYAWYVRTKSQEEEDWPAPSEAATSPAPPAEGRPARSSITLVTASQVALVGFAGWMMLSALWSAWPAGAFGEGVRQLVITVWAVALGRSLSRRGVRAVAFALVVVLAVTAFIGVWYYFERNPDQRLKFPIGNPIFLAACLIPGITLASALGAAALTAGGEARRWGLVAGAILALVVLIWAFVLTDSRGPMVGLAAGLVAAGYLALAKPWRWILVGGVIAASVLMLALRVGPGAWLLSRPDTVRLRLYTWGYAADLFLEQPGVGLGQGAYFLNAQRLSRPDAEADPAAFPGPAIAHAHSEWLEILADLGAIGFGLLATAIVLTLWAAVQALRRGPPRSRDWWLLLGLSVTLVALMVEEASDVALRFPGLPLIFYTVVGLTWAAARPPQAADRNGRPGCGPAVRGLGLGAAVVGAVGITLAVGRDFEGALADRRIDRYAAKLDWDRALRAADVATTHRLDMGARIGGRFESARTAHAAAAQQLDQLSRMAARFEDPDTRDPRILRLAEEDAQIFVRYGERVLDDAASVWDRMPGYPGVATLAADVHMMRQQLEAVLQEFGRVAEVNVSSEPARAWLEREFARDRLNAMSGLRLLRLSGGQPLAEQIDMIRLPLRRGPMAPDFRPALNALMQHPDFGAVLDRLQQAAQAARAARDASAWPDAYAPETLRLAARAHEMRNRFDEAVRFAAEGVALSQVIRDRFTLIIPYALLEQARYELLARPDQPQRALHVCRQALVEFPTSGHVRERAEVYRRIAQHLLADGDEKGAGQQIVLASSDGFPARLEHELAVELADLCVLFGRFPPEARPASYASWQARCLELDPEWPPAHQLAIAADLESGRADAAFDRLRAVEELFDTPEQFGLFLQAVTSRFPEHSGLQTFVAEWAAAHGFGPADTPPPPAASRPAASLPATQAP